MRRKSRWFVILVFPAVVALVAATEQVLKEFGIDGGEPINEGYFFYEGRYIDAPYVVERRGLDIYINDVLVRKGPDWPPYDERVKEDPGDPPPGSSPLDPTPPGMDPRDTYWSKKSRYVLSHYDQQTAREKMVETYRKCTEFREVIWDGKGPFLHVIDNTGKKTGIYMGAGMGFGKRPPTKEEVRQRMDRGKAYYENLLRGEVTLFKFKSGELGFSGDRSLKAVEILLSDVSDEEKVKAFEEMTSRPGEVWFQQIVTEFKASPQLAERLKALKEKQRKQALDAAARAIAEKIEHSEAMKPGLPPAVDVGPSTELAPEEKKQPEVIAEELAKAAETPGEPHPTGFPLLPWLPIGLGALAVVAVALVLVRRSGRG